VQVFILSLNLNASAQECWGDRFSQWHVHGSGFFFNFVAVAKVGIILKKTWLEFFTKNQTMKFFQKCEDSSIFWTIY
jgi:hypothetical protein